MSNISVVCAINEPSDIDELRIDLARCAEKAIELAGRTIPCDVCIMLSDDESIQALNLEHRGKDAATDVLSFPMQELVPGVDFTPTPLELDPESGALLLGDIVISMDRAKAQSVEFGHSMRRELCFLAVHGVLHLLGYDHERGADDEAVQFGLQDKVLLDLGITREG
ncbi:MAG: rRNA maturation RNase YbeY [Clostridia bacterium]